MRLTPLATYSLVIVLGLTSGDSLVAQNQPSPSPGKPPAKTYRPGPWQPVARVNPLRPVSLRLTNATDVPIEYDYSTQSKPSPTLIRPGETQTLTQVPLPVNLLINAVSSVTPPDSQDFSLYFEIKETGDNGVEVNVKKVDLTVPGHTTFDLQNNGGIYVY